MLCLRTRSYLTLVIYFNHHKVRYYYSHYQKGNWGLEIICLRSHGKKWNDDCKTTPSAPTLLPFRVPRWPNAGMMLLGKWSDRRLPTRAVFFFFFLDENKWLWDIPQPYNPRFLWNLFWYWNGFWEYFMPFLWKTSVEGTTFQSRKGIWHFKIIMGNK